MINTVFGSIGIPFVPNDPTVSGITYVELMPYESKACIVIPQIPLAYGVRALLVWAENRENLSIKLDPICRNDMPVDILCWAAGLVAMHIDQHIITRHREMAPLLGEIASLDENNRAAFNNFYAETILARGADVPLAYKAAQGMVDKYKEDRVHRQARTDREENLLKVSKHPGMFKEVQNILSLVSGNDTDEEIEQMKVVIIQLASLVDSVKHFADNVIGQAEEYNVLVEAVEVDNNFRNGKQRALRGIRALTNTIYVNVATRAVDWAVAFHEKSVLASVVGALPMSTPEDTFITYHVPHSASEEFSSKAKDQLLKWNASKAQVSNRETKFISDATAFARGVSIMAWSVERLHELQTYHRETIQGAAIPKQGSRNGHSQEQIRDQLAHEKTGGILYRKTFADNVALVRFMVPLANTDIEALRTTQGKTTIHTALEEKLTGLVAGLEFWTLRDFSNWRALNEVYYWMVYFGGPTQVRQADMIMPFVYTVPEDKGHFHGETRVTDIVEGYNRLLPLNPLTINWPVVSVQKFDTSSLNLHAPSVLGNIVKSVWDKNVYMIQAEARDKIEYARNGYDVALKDILRVCNTTKITVKDVYKAVIKNITTKMDTYEQHWWTLVDGPLKSTHQGFEELATPGSIINRELFLNLVNADKSWSVYFGYQNTPDEKDKWANSLYKYVINDVSKRVNVPHKSLQMVALAIREMGHRWDAMYASGDQMTPIPTIEFSGTDFSSITIEGDNFRGLPFHRILSMLMGDMPRELLREIFKWIRDGKSRWLITNHSETNFTLLATSVTPETGSTISPINAFYHLLQYGLFLLRPLVSVLKTDMRDVKPTDLLSTAGGSLYGFVMTRQGTFSVTEGETNKVDVYERLGLSEIDKRKGNDTSAISLSERAKETLHAATGLARYIVTVPGMPAIDLHLAFQCLTGTVWGKYFYPKLAESKKQYDGLRERSVFSVTSNRLSGTLLDKDVLDFANVIPQGFKGHFASPNNLPVNARFKPKENIHFVHTSHDEDSHEGAVEGGISVSATPMSSQAQIAIPNLLQNMKTNNESPDEPWFDVNHDTSTQSNRSPLTRTTATPTSKGVLDELIRTGDTAVGGSTDWTETTSVVREPPTTRIDTSSPVVRPAQFAPRPIFTAPLKPTAAKAAGPHISNTPFGLNVRSPLPSSVYLSPIDIQSQKQPSKAPSLSGQHQSQPPDHKPEDTTAEGSLPVLLSPVSQYQPASGHPESLPLTPSNQQPISTPANTSLVSATRGSGPLSGKPSEPVAQSPEHATAITGAASTGTNQKTRAITPAQPSTRPTSADTAFTQVKFVSDTTTTVTTAPAQTQTHVSTTSSKSPSPVGTPRGSLAASHIDAFPRTTSTITCPTSSSVPTTTQTSRSGVATRELPHIVNQNTRTIRPDQSTIRPAPRHITTGTNIRRPLGSPGGSRRAASQIGGFQRGSRTTTFPTPSPLPTTTQTSRRWAARGGQPQTARKPSVKISVHTRDFNRHVAYMAEGNESVREVERTRHEQGDWFMF